MKKYSIIAISLMATALSVSAVTISSFGSALEAADLTGNWAGDYVAGTSTLSGVTDFGGAIQDFTSIGSIDISGATSLYLTAFASTNPGTDFVIRLYDSAFDDTLTATFDWDSFSSGSTTVAATLVVENVAGGFDNIIGGWELNPGGSVVSPNPLAVQFTSLATVVPEPSTYAAFAGLLALGYVMVRRRS